MARIYLCGHTGSENRGCEAIVRSTVKILQKIGVKDITLMTFRADQDEAVDLHKVVNLLPYRKYQSVYQRYYSGFRKKVLGDYYYGEKIKQGSLTDAIQTGDLAFNIGGDTYCYGRPTISYAMNKFAHERNISTVFWGCSVDERLTKNEEMRHDVDSFDIIVSRECLSTAIIKNSAKSPSIYQCCDPAFQLNKQETSLPASLIIGNTLGINLSPIVCPEKEITKNSTYHNTIALIHYMIQNTGMNICLIPHVYNAQKNTQDIAILREIYRVINNPKRVCLIDQDLSCEELKYIISKCRFFIGARTHSTIAAYSTCVPTIALSYSIKSRGIATDLFGSDEGYAIPYKSLNNEMDLTNAFITLMDKEEFIHKLYSKIIPAYQQSIIKTTKKVLEELHFEF